jgi:hypothetical protein
VPRLFVAVAVLVGAGVLALACSSSPPAASRVVLAPGHLSVEVTSVTPTLEPYNPQFSNHGIPAEHIKYIVSAVHGSNVPQSFHCSVVVFRSGLQVGTTILSTGAPPGYPQLEAAVDVQVKGDNFRAKPSDVHMRCYT